MADNDHISIVEIEHDIQDTEREISCMEREVRGLRLIGDRLSHYRADAKMDGIRQRKEFIGKLKKILEERAQAEHCSCGDREHPCVEHPDMGVE